MGFHLQYADVCSVHLWHDFVLARGATEFAGLDDDRRAQIRTEYSVHDFLRLRPTEATQRTLQRHALRFVPHATGFSVAGPVQPSPHDPAKLVLERPLPPAFHLQFTVDIVRPAFVTEASLPSPGVPGTLFLFSNHANHVAPDGELHLTAPLAGFDPARAYTAGDRVVDALPNATVLLEAAEDLSPSATPAVGKWVELPAPRYRAAHVYATGETALHNGALFIARNPGVLPSPPSAAHWTKLYDAQLRTGVSAADQVVGLTRTSRFPLQPPLPAVKVIVRDRNLQVVHEETQVRRDFNLLEEVRLALPAAEPGLYSLSVETLAGGAVPGFPARFFLHEAPRPWAVIELANPVGGLAVFDVQGQLRQPTYHVRFRHRRAFWRYVFHGDLAGLPPANLGDLVQEDPADPARYATTSPVPMNAGLVALKPFGGRQLPNPGPASTRKDHGKPYAETFLTR